MKKAELIEVSWRGLPNSKSKIGKFNASKIMTRKLMSTPDFSVDVFEEVEVEVDIVDSPKEIRKTINFSSKLLFGSYYFKGV